MPNQNAPIARLARWIDATFATPAPLTTETPAPVWLVWLAAPLVLTAEGIALTAIGAWFGLFLAATVGGWHQPTQPGTLEARAHSAQIGGMWQQANLRHMAAWNADDQSQARLDAMIQADYTAAAWYRDAGFVRPVVR